MDFLLSGPLCTEHFSLEDMIERDIKSEFDELTNGNYHTNIINTSNDMDSLAVGLTDDNSLTSDLLNQNGAVSMDMISGVTATSNVLRTVTGITSATEPIDSKPDISMNWLQADSLGTLTTDILRGNDSGEVLMVNPQTGIPVKFQAVSTPSLSVAQPQSRVQFVTATVAPGSTLQQTLQGLQQQQQQQQLVKNSVGLHSIQNAHLITQALTSRTSAPQTVSLSRQPTQQQNSPSLVTQQLLTSSNNHMKKTNKPDNCPTKVFPKPVYSYSCLIAMALKNSETGALPVSEIYSFMTQNFPYFYTAPDGWKNSVRHNLSLNKCFEKIENPKATGNTRKGCLWGLRPAKIEKMDDEIAKWRKKDLEAIHRSMAKPEVLEILEKGNITSQSPRHPNSIHSIPKKLASLPKTLTPAILHSNNVVTLTTNSQMVAPVSTITKSALGDIQLSMIEIKPAEYTPMQTPVKIKVEPIIIKPESMDHSGAVGVPLSTEDLNLLDTSLSLDPTLSELALQSGLWEELGADGGISLDDISLSSFGQAFSNSSSPLTVQANKSELCSGSATSPLVSLLTSNVGANAKGASGAHTVTPSGGLAINRTIFAQM